MFRSLKWIASIALGLSLAWQCAPLSAQSFAADEEPAPLETDQEAAEGEESAIADDQEASETDEMSAEEGDANPLATSDEAASDEMPNDEADGDQPSADYDQDASTEQPAEEAIDGGPQTEVIKERYPNGATKTERETTQDAQGNYVNHGMFKTFNERGALTAQGEYENGKRTGPWIRWYRSVTESKMLTQQPYQQFAGPFISQATFVNDELDGTWTIYDGRKHKISEWHFKNGRRHGPSIWWLPTGSKLREMNFRDGELDGEWSEWRPNGSLIGKDRYAAGRKQALKVSHHQGGAKKSEGMYLFAKEIEQTPDDWWQCKPMTMTRTGKDERHGPWSAWYPNGQRQQEGTFEHDLQAGPFTWWHSNGQKALQGKFESGKQDGRWTWWYASGQKSIQGDYSLGNPTGRWTWWKEDGKVAQSADLSQSEGVAIEMPKLPDTKAATPQAKKPQPRVQIKR